MSELWTILIASLGQRADRLHRLLDGLTPQLDEYDGAVTVLVLYNHGERPLNQVRYDLLAAATGRYASFVDDDDVLPDYHVQRVVDCVANNDVDYVGWRMQCYVDGTPLAPTYHSLRYNGWSQDCAGFYRDVSHLNPIRTELARRVDYRTCVAPEDVNWARHVRQHVKTECYVPDVMYHYYSSPSDSTWRGVRTTVNYARPVLSHPYVNYHPASSS